VIEGSLLYNDYTERYDLIGAGRLLSLHCGDCFELKKNGKYIPVRIEFGKDWYLIAGKKHISDFKGMQARM